jgi:periplasmic copper chaperone A
MLRIRTKAALAALPLALASCGPPAPLHVDGAWIRLPAVPGRPAAAYFTIHGGPKDETLIDVSCDVANHAEMHESMGGGMKRLEGVRVPARADTSFAPGGRHMMLFDLSPSIKVNGDYVPRLLFTFADNSKFETSATVVGAGDPAPSH